MLSNGPWYTGVTSPVGAMTPLLLLLSLPLPLLSEAQGADSRRQGRFLGAVTVDKGALVGLGVGAAIGAAVVGPALGALGGAPAGTCGGCCGRRRRRADSRC